MKIILTYRRTSRVSMRIGKEGSVRVSAPYGYPRAKVEAFIEAHQAWIAQAREKQAQHQRKEDDFYAALPLHTAADKKAAKEGLHAIIEPLLKHYSAIMQVKPSAIHYRASKTRWGSCQARSKSINFSLYLLLLPKACIEHVVVHELAHLIEPNHSSSFYRLMDRYYPSWKEARAYTSRIVKGLS